MTQLCHSPTLPVIAPQRQLEGVLGDGGGAHPKSPPVSRRIDSVEYPAPTGRKRIVLTCSARLPGQRRRHERRVLASSPWRNKTMRRIHIMQPHLMMVEIKTPPAGQTPARNRLLAIQCRTAQRWPDLRPRPEELRPQHQPRRRRQSTPSDFQVGGWNKIGRYRDMAGLCRGGRGRRGRGQFTFRAGGIYRGKTVRYQAEKLKLVPCIPERQERANAAARGKAAGGVIRK